MPDAETNQEYEDYPIEGSAPRVKHPWRWPLLGATAAVLAVEIGLHLAYLPRLERSGLLGFGGIAELMIGLLLVLILVALQSRELPGRIHAWLSIGLGLWLISCTADILDEVVLQPLWVSAFLEDVPRIAGMGLTSLGLLALVRHAAAVVRELQTLSLRETLTGLGNRRRFNQVVAEREPTGYGLLLMDLDHFKGVNDRFGHAVGDEVLSRVAEVLRDLSPPNAESFRLGGEEFAVVTESLDESALEVLARRICRSVAALRPRQDLSVTMSIGVGRSRRDEPQLELMQRVDRALYRAKADGRNRVALAEA